MSRKKEKSVTNRSSYLALLIQTKFHSAAHRDKILNTAFDSAI